MKTVIILAGLVALALGSEVPVKHSFKVKDVDAAFVERQKKVLDLFQDVDQVNPNDEYYKIGKEYNIEANIDNYSNKKAVEEFLQLYRTGFLPKYYEFSPFYDRLRDEAIGVFHLFYYAKDFDTFYKSAAWARVYLNEGQFLYAYYIAVIQRKDTQGFVVPAPYEVYPQFFANLNTMLKVYRTKMQDGVVSADLAAQHGIVKENNYYVYYANYSNSLVYNNEEQRLSYFTEDIGLNSYYYYFHSHLPFWWNSERYGALKSRRGEIYYYFYQQLMARYYFERLSNGLGDIPEFSWYSPVKSGYYPLMSSYYYPFAQRPNYWNVHSEENYEKVRFLDTYEMSFLQFLQNGHFKAFDQKIDFHDFKAINFVGNYWQDNADLYGEEVTKNYQRSYEIIARQVLGAAPKPFDKYTFMPSALDFYQTSLRDPMFYQLYNRILKYIYEYKQYLQPYSSEKLAFKGVKVVDVVVDKLVTFFEYYDFDASNSVFWSKEEVKSSYPHDFKIRQPRLNHKPFSVSIDIKSEAAVDAVVKIFMAPKYDDNGFPLKLENNWNKFFELDWFTYKFVAGDNKIVRNSNDFLIFKDDSVPMTELYKLLEQNKVPHDMSEDYGYLPKRLMLPRGTEGGFPFQFFVFVYPFNADSKDLAPFEAFIQDNKPLGYPFDRPVVDAYFKQHNMFFKDVFVYHDGEYFPYKFNVPSHVMHSNVVPKH
ncbi:arylphorin subunit beta [Manduca sexta]|uniref:arylphorin subunit beta n=1 Tax=Manduca sexta TaxID=7130 RepID=UPI0018903E4A|nr:arylphorin subunit beta [Manduca sexta]